MKKLLPILLLLIFVTGLSQERRLALVIVNSAYGSIGELKNPVNDANAMKKALSGKARAHDHNRPDQIDHLRPVLSTCL